MGLILNSGDVLLGAVCTSVSILKQDHMLGRPEQAFQSSERFIYDSGPTIVGLLALHLVMDNLIPSVVAIPRV